MFNTQDGLLLIAGQTTGYIMNLKTKAELCRARHPDQREGVWINHPTFPNLLVKVDTVQARQYLWKTFLPEAGSSLQAAQLSDSLGKG